MQSIDTEQAFKEKVGNDVLIALLEQDSVPMETLHKRYGSLLELVRVLIGVVPECDRYLCLLYTSPSPRDS